jgi:aryl-alcohol dehydrogenase-like predicted oxidoreductase
VDKIKKLTLGTAQLGLDYGIANKSGKPSVDKAYSILDKAIEQGIRSFDTAYAYGSSEKVLGNYFVQNKDILKESVITTKIVLGNSPEQKKEKISDVVSEKIQTSLERLKVDIVDNLMLHHVSDLDKYKDDIVSALLRVKEKGYTKKIGISAYNQDDLEKIMKYDAFECVQIPINIIDMRLIKEGMLKKLKSNSVYIYARSVFLQGLFFMNYEKIPKNLGGAGKYLKVLNNLSDKLGMSIAELALAYVRDIEEVDSLVIGAETPEQIQENVELINSPSIPIKYMKQISEYFENVPEFYLEPWRWELEKE